jgi:hypothetical protein
LHIIGFEPYDPDFECGGTGSDRQCPFETKETDLSPGMTIQGLSGRLFHVGIASYRDPLCPKTLYNLFTKSKHPEKIRVRVIQQNGMYAGISFLKLTKTTSL